MSSGHWIQTSDFSSGHLQTRVRRFESQKTHLKIVLADVEGPLVNGYFCLATEAFDDDGLPHTLEHLVFMGSQQYPYKGVLDLIANRCLSSGTNAWTDVDHTCYTMTTVGSEGFLSMFPVYVDHILFPTLKKAGYVTEVHHVNGDGEDAGVVYCEMQGRENSGESLVHLALNRALYPGKCGYKSETGGIMKNLRESTSHEKVKNYHREFYRAENLCLIVTGIIEPQRLFDSLSEIEDRILNIGEKRDYIRPWQSEVPPLISGAELSVPYPCDEEDNGMVNVGWRGPSGADFKILFATIAIMEYLTESAVSPLNSVFVEVDDPLASRVYYYLAVQKDCAVIVVFENVPVPKLELVKPKLDKCLSEIKSIDMNRMSVILERRISEFKASMEVSPHDIMTNIAIADAIYGQSNDDLNSRLNPDRYYQKLLEENSEFWMEILAEISKKPKVFAKGVPSKDLQEKMANQEKSRIEEQKASLGECGLDTKKDILDDAIDENEIEAPNEVFEKFRVPGVDSISFHPIETAQTMKEPNPKLDLNLTNFQFPGIFSDVKTSFVYLDALFDTKDLPKELKAYLPLLSQLLFELPIEENGQTLDYEEVIKQLDSEVIQRKLSIGAAGYQYKSGIFSDMVILELQVEKEKYFKGVQWFDKLLNKTVFNVERIKVVTTKAENGIAQIKRSGSSMASAAHKLVLYQNNSNQFWNVALVQQKFLKDVLKKMENPVESLNVVNNFMKLRDFLKEKITFHVAADFKNLENVFQPFDNLPFQALDKQIPIVTPDNHYSNANAHKHLLIGVGSVESSFLIRSCPGIRDYQDPDLPALMLYFQYLSQLEGPMWRKIRGVGLSYGYSISADVSQGLIVLSLTKSTHPSKAFQAANKIISESLEADFEWNILEFESAKSSLIFELVDNLQSIAGVVLDNLCRILKQLGPAYKRKLLDQIMRVTLEDLKAVGQKYVNKILDHDSSNTVLICHPSKLEQTQQEFKEVNIEFQVFKNLEEATDTLI